MTPYATANDIEGDARKGVIDLLYRLADDDLFIGHRNSEWTGLAPILEADIAFSSMAQDQMGQAAAYYRLLHDLGEPDPDTNAFLRRPEQFHCASLTVFEKGNWAFSTVRLYLYESAKSLRVAALGQSSYTPLAVFARKVRGEQKYHLMHARMWINKLGDATEESHRLMQTALNELYPHGLGLFEPTQWDKTIVFEGVGPPEDALCQRWRGEVAGVLTESGLSVPHHVDPAYGGRTGSHPPALAALLDAMQKVYRLDPAATW